MLHSRLWAVRSRWRLMRAGTWTMCATSGQAGLPLMTPKLLKARSTTTCRFRCSLWRTIWKATRTKCSNRTPSSEIPTRPSKHFRAQRRTLFHRLKRASTFTLIIRRYKLYEDATFAALIDRYGDGSGSTCSQPQELPVVMVVGAGRGPIVRAALQVLPAIIESFLAQKVVDVFLNSIIL